MIVASFIDPLKEAHEPIAKVSQISNEALYLGEIELI